MKTESLIGHATELVRIIRKSVQPADAVASEYLRERKYVGARDRRFISSLVFHTMRIYSLAEAWAKHNNHEDVVQAAFELGEGIVEGAPEKPDDSWTSDLPLHIKVCTQEWLLEETKKRWPDDAADVWSAMMNAAPVGLRVNLRRTSRENVLKALRDENIPCEAGVHAPGAINVFQRINILQHPLYENGFIEIQDEGSQLVTLACNAQQNTSILDACAGAGGKTMHLADIINDMGEIVAQDIEWQRLKQVPFRARRAGIKCITVQTVRAQDPPLPGKYDVVLVDAPCSGMGTVRRMPMPKWRLTESQARRHAAKQLQLLERFARNVKSGGALVYSTCSILPTENEEVVQRFIGDGSEFAVEFQQQYDPWHHGTDGLFVCRLRSRSM